MRRGSLSAPSAPGTVLWRYWFTLSMENSFAVPSTSIQTCFAINLDDRVRPHPTVDRLLTRNKHGHASSNVRFGGMRYTYAEGPAESSPRNGPPHLVPCRSHRLETHLLFRQVNRANRGAWDDAKHKQGRHKPSWSCGVVHCGDGE